MASLWARAIGGLLLSTLAGVGLRTVAIVATVEGQSMFPALRHGDRVLVLRRRPAGRLRTGDIVLVQPWGRPTPRWGPRSDHLFIKRVVGLPGETLTLPQAEAVRGWRAESDQAALPVFRTWHIPPGHVFVRGDQLSSTADSRRWGPIPVQNVLGVVVRKLQSTSAAGRGRRPLAPPGGLRAGRGAPPFTAESLEGKRVALADYSGRPLALIFVAPGELWRASLGEYSAAYEAARRAGASLVLISLAEMEPTRVFVEEHSVAIPVLLAPPARNSMMRDYNIRVWPSYCLIDGHGVILSSGHPNRHHGDWNSWVMAWATSATGSS